MPLSRQRQYRPLAICPGKAGQSRSLLERGDGCPRQPKAAADKLPPPETLEAIFQKRVLGIPWKRVELFETLRRPYPRYAFFTAALFSNSLPVPLRVIRPVSRT